MDPEFPQYKCHKVVGALQIRHLIAKPDGGADMTPEEEGFPMIELDAAFVKKHEPKPGGYLLRYEDGYRSFSPAKAFEGGYTSIGKPIGV